MSDSVDGCSPPDPADALRLVQAFLKMPSEARAELIRTAESQARVDRPGDPVKIESITDDDTI